MLNPKIVFCWPLLSALAEVCQAVGFNLKFGTESRRRKAVTIPKDHFQGFEATLRSPKLAMIPGIAKSLGILRPSSLDLHGT